MDGGQESQLPKHSDVTTLRATFDTVIKAHYPTIQGHVAIRAVFCPAVCVDVTNLLSG